MFDTITLCRYITEIICYYLNIYRMLSYEKHSLFRYRIHICTMHTSVERVAYVAHRPNSISTDSWYQTTVNTVFSLSFFQLCYSLLVAHYCSLLLSLLTLLWYRVHTVHLVCVLLLFINSDVQTLEKYKNVQR